MSSVDGIKVSRAFQNLIVSPGFEIHILISFSPITGSKTSSFQPFSSNIEEYVSNSNFRSQVKTSSMLKTG